MTLNFETICRTCMTQTHALMCIFDDENSSANDIVSMLQSVTSIQASKNDGLPEQVCIACVSEINRAFSFKNRSERSEQTLRQYLNRYTSKPITYMDSKISTDSVRSGTTDDGYEMIEKDEEDIEHIDHDDTNHNLSDSELKDNYQIEMKPNDDDENSSNKSLDIMLDRRKVFVLGAMTLKENESNTISVIYECHICFETFESISLSEERMERMHSSGKESQCEDETTEQMTCPIYSLTLDNSIMLHKHIREMHPNDIDIGDEDFVYKPEDANLTGVVEGGETPHTIQDEFEDENIVQDIETNEMTSHDQFASVIMVSANESIEPELKFNCEKCGGKFAKERSLNIHIKLNKCTIKSFECSVCKKVFVRKKNLENHMQTHNESNDYSCKVCSEKFTQADKLAIHIQTKHEPSRKYLCPYCWKGFNVSSSLKDHIRIHNGERPYLCSICGKGFSQSTNLNQHVMRHNKTKPYSCLVCSYSFVSKGELDAHSRKHSGLHPFVCEVCGASFTTSSSLVKHTRIHTGERPYACEFCPMRFAALGALKNHTRTHSGARPFACGICGRTFPQRSDCLSHQETHSADKSFFCKQCFQSFHKKSGLRNHMKTHRKECTEPIMNNSDDATIHNDSVKLTYVSEIYSSNDN